MKEKEIINCQNIDDYINSIVNFSESKIPRLVNDPYEKESSLESFLKEVKIHNSSCHSDEACIIAICNEIPKWMALALAKVKKYNLFIANNKYMAIRKAESLRDKYKYFNFLALAHEISTSDLRNFSIALNERYYSFIIHRTYSELSSLIADISLNDRGENKTIHIDKLNPIKKINSENISFYDFKNSTVANIKEELHGKDSEIFSIIGHGRDEFIWLQDGVICSKLINSKIENQDIPKPACFYTGKCYKSDNEILHGYEIKTNNIFMNSCYSGMFEDASYGIEYNMLYGLIGNNTNSYIGSTCAVDGRDFLNFYYIFQMKSGVRLGKVVANLNQVYKNLGLGHEWSYCLIGDAYKKLDSRTKVKKISWNNKKNEDTNIVEKEIVIREKTGLITIDLGHTKISEFNNFSKRIEVKSSSNKDIYGVLRKENLNNYLDIFSDDVLNNCSITIKIYNGKYFNSKEINFLNQLSTLGLNFGNKYQSRLKEITDMSLAFVKNKKYLLPYISENKKLYKKLVNIENGIDDLSTQALDSLKDKINRKSFSLEETLLENGITLMNNLPTNQKCPYCEKVLTINRYEHNFYSHQYWDYYCCTKCGVIEVDQTLGSLIEPSIHGENQTIVGKSLHNKLKIMNKTNNIVNLKVRLCMTRSEENGIKIDNDEHTIALAPNSSTNIPIQIDSSRETIPHVYWLKVLIYIDGQIISLKKDIYFKW